MAVGREAVGSHRHAGSEAPGPRETVPGAEVADVSTEVQDDLPLNPRPTSADQPEGPDRTSQAGQSPAATEVSGLYAPMDGAFHRIAKMTANVFDAPIATVSILGDDRVWFPAAEGLGEMTEAPIDPDL